MGRKQPPPEPKRKIKGIEWENRPSMAQRVGEPMSHREKLFWVGVGFFVTIFLLWVSSL